jgi:hypothetical protein
VALLVIVCGALLVIGGAISLLMGFDIVMTERGSAMTLGGVIALSGGVISAGIGFALLRLSQILAALQERNVRGVRPAVPPDRPVVPLVSPDPVTTEVLPLPLVAESGAGRIGLGAGVAAAGLAAAAAVVATSKTSAETSEPDTVAAQEAADPAVGSIEMPDMQEPSPGDTAKTIATLPPPVGSIPDLEEELARALAEPEVASAPVVAREKSFADGLSDLLARSKGRRRKHEPEQELDPELDQHVEDVEAALPEPFAETTDNTASTDESIINPDLPDVQIEAHEPIVTEPEVVVSATSETADSADESTDADMMVTPPSAPVIPSKKILGTYNAGGRTYSMYADGSVEAVTEFGVERFRSMDELRRHLAKA